MPETKPLLLSKDNVWFSWGVMAVAVVAVTYLVRLDSRWESVAASVASLQAAVVGAQGTAESVADQMVDHAHRLESAMAQIQAAITDRWTVSDMENWRLRAQIANPSVVWPPLNDGFHARPSK